MKLTVNGRHLGNATFFPENIVSEFSIHDNSVTLRLDDPGNLAWWLQIDIPKEILQKLLKEMEAI